MSLLLIAFSMFAQETKKNQDDIYYAPKSVTQWSAEADKDQAAKIVTCLDNYRKERQIAFGFAVAGIGCATASAFLEGDQQKTVSLIGGVAMITGGIIYLRAERWLSRKNMTFTGNGVSLKF